MTTGTCQSTEEGRHQLHSKRSHLEIIAEILRSGSAGKTDLMFNVNMSHEQAGKYLAVLQSRGYMEKETRIESKTLYRCTEKGRKLVGGIDAVLSLLRWEVFDSLGN